MKNTSLIYSALLSSALLYSLAGCGTTPGQEWKPTAGVTTVVNSSYDLGVSQLGYGSGSIPVDYSSTNIELGATLVSEGSDRPIKHQFAGIAFGSGELEDGFGGAIDGDEISGGGRYYYDEGNAVIPFISIWSVLTDADGATPQLGLRIGGGAEYPLNSNAALTLSGDYLIPINDAQDEFFPGVTYDISGLSFRFGVRFMF